jgi:hypothetical protein
VTITAAIKNRPSPVRSRVSPTAKLGLGSSRTSTTSWAGSSSPPLVTRMSIRPKSIQSQSVVENNSGSTTAGKKAASGHPPYRRELGRESVYSGCRGSASLCRWLGGEEGVRFLDPRAEYPMRLISLSVMISFALLSPPAVAQQPSEPTAGRSVGDTIGHPPPLAGPPAIPDPSPTLQPGPTESTPPAKEPAPKGYTGSYAPAGTPPTAYSTGALPSVDSGPGLDRTAPDGSTKTVRAVPCSTAAHETDGFTTCVGIPDSSLKRHRR